MIFTRIILSLLVFGLTVVFGWWSFLLFVLIYIYLVKIPYEVIFVGYILDSIYFFGDNFFLSYKLTIYSLICILLSVYIKDKIEWNEVV